MRSSSALGTFWEGLRRCGAWHFYGTGLPATTSPVGCWRVSTSHHLSHTRLSSSSSYSSFVAGDKLETHPMSYGPPTAPTRCSIRQTTVRRRLAEHGKMAPLLKQASNADRTQLHTSSAVPSTVVPRACTEWAQPLDAIAAIAASTCSCSFYQQCRLESAGLVCRQSCPWRRGRSQQVWPE